MGVKTSSKSQIEKFRETARKIGADESEDRFNEALRQVAKGNPKPLAKEIGHKDEKK